ncbi:MAG TPA: glycosyltransferase family 1 protein [Candidatus Saccharimonadales bacterium]|nr:glycosyltransferase family 1 protein [Candidatus Saccharimonadales bacterium]
MKKHHIVIDARVRRASTGRYIAQLVEHLQNVDHFHRYTILVQPDDDWKMRAGNFKTVPCPFPQFSFNPLHEIRFTRQLYKLKADLVHFAMTQQPLLYFGNIVTTTHDLIMFDFARPGRTPRPIFWVKMLLYRFLFFWSHLKSKRIIVPTKFVAADLKRYQPWDNKKVVVTYEAALPPLTGKGEPVEDVREPFLLYVSNVFPHKNADNLVKAFDILHQTRPSLQLVLVGKKEQYYERLAKLVATLPAADHILMPGFKAYVTDQQLKWLYERCAAYVYPSLADGFGLSPLEAMTHDAPVVVSEASCLPEVCGPAAHYCNPHSPRDIAEKVDEVLSSKKLRDQLVAAGKERLKLFSWQKMADETLLVYESLLAPAEENG